MAAAKRQTSVIDESTLGVTSVFGKTGEHAVLDHAADRDEQVLVALGYKQEFKRDFTIWSSFSVSFSILGLLPSIASTLTYNLGYIGISGSLYSYLIAGIFIQFVGLSMAELCSSMPTAGGLYYASAVLAPEGWGPLCAWITGWSNFMGCIAGPLSINYALALMILAAVQINDDSFVPKTWQVYLILLGLLAINGILTMNSTKFLARMNVIGTWVNLIALVIFCIWLPVGSINPKNTNSQVWGSAGFKNGTEWPTGFSFLMSFLTAIYTMGGYDAPFHLSEECSNANVAGPRAIIATTQGGLWLGWLIIIAIAYTVKNVTEVVDGPYGQPLGSLCLQVLGKKPALVLFSFNMLAQFFVAQGATVASSRVIYAYSRDGALPGSRWLSIVNARTATPVNAIWFPIILAVLFGLLMFASPVAMGAVFSIGAIAQYVAFTVPIALKIFGPPGRFRPGPFHLGRFSKPCGLIACTYVLLMVPILCFPAVKGKDLNLLNMNWSCLLYGGTMTLALAWYAVSARHWFKGPKVNVEHVGGKVVEGVGGDESPVGVEYGMGKREG